MSDLNEFAPADGFDDLTEGVGSLFGDEPQGDEPPAESEGELDELLEESLGLKAGSVELSFDELLAESMQAVSEEQKVKELKAKLARDSGGLNPLEREELQARIDAWEMVHVWQREASVAVFHRQVCKGCGHSHEVFKHFMIRCSGRKDSSVQRWYGVREYDWHLPREVIFTEGQVPLCAECACFEGFNLGEGEVKAHGHF